MYISACKFGFIGWKSENMRYRDRIFVEFWSILFESTCRSMRSPCGSSETGQGSCGSMHGSTGSQLLQRTLFQLKNNSDLGKLVQLSQHLGLSPLIAFQNFEQNQERRVMSLFKNWLPWCLNLSIKAPVCQWVCLFVCLFVCSLTPPKRRTPASWNIKGWFPLE